jgi:glycerophosphoryl diester phosphodiesterase
MLEIIAHRGVHGFFPENTLEAFESAVALGADGVELDVRLTRDKVPIVYHYFYLDMLTNLSGPVFNFSLDEILDAKISGTEYKQVYRIPTLREILDALVGRIGLEIEIKGPEPESSAIIAELLADFPNFWDTLEVTSYEPILLFDLKKRCPSIQVDLLIPPAEVWMGSDVIAYTAIERAKLANARGVHLHHTQLKDAVISPIIKSGLCVHAWDVNDDSALDKVQNYGIPRFDTDNLQIALNYRARHS